MKNNKMKEIWKDIKDYEGLYQVSNLGRIKSLIQYDVENGYMNEEHIINGWNNRGYMSVCLTKNKKHRNFYIHRLVASAFIENEDSKPYVNHLDYNPLNNSVSNLEWCTQKENVNWSIEHMRKPRKNHKHSNTGEKYIYKRKNKELYRVIIKGYSKEYSFSNIVDAIKKRDELVSEIFTSK